MIDIIDYCKLEAKRAAAQIMTVIGAHVTNHQLVGGLLYEEFYKSSAKMVTLPESDYEKTGEHLANISCLPGTSVSFVPYSDAKAPAAFDLPCRFCDAGAVAIYYFDKGCFCCPNDRLQALCEQHVDRATPIEGMRFVCRPPGVRRRDD